MRRYDDGEFIENEPSRKSTRDRFRDHFFGQLGVERLKDPFAYDPDPTDQLETIKRLIDTTLALHGDDKAALEMMKALIGASALGVPLASIGAGTVGRPDFQGSTIESMFKAMFHEWFGSSNYDDGAQ
jgi:hypothetical protein